MNLVPVFMCRKGGSPKQTHKYSSSRRRGRAVLFFGLPVQRRLAAQQAATPCFLLFPSNLVGASGQSERAHLDVAATPVALQGEVQPELLWAPSVATTSPDNTPPPSPPRGVLCTCAVPLLSAAKLDMPGRPHIMFNLGSVFSCTCGMVHADSGSFFAERALCLARKSL